MSCWICVTYEGRHGREQSKQGDPKDKGYLELVVRPPSHYPNPDLAVDKPPKGMHTMYSLGQG
jgi:hypothetical protein